MCPEDIALSGGKERHADPAVRRAWVEWVVRRLIGVDQYADVAERLACYPSLAPLLRALYAHKVNPAVRDGRLLFIHVPKNGGTSIKHVLYASDPGHMTARLYGALAPDLLDRSTSFAILRDPVDRFLSAFDFLMEGGGSHVTVHAIVRERLRAIRTIDDFIALIEARRDWFAIDTVARPQHWYLVDVANRVRVKQLWLLGEHGGAIRAFLATQGVRYLPHLNVTKRSHRTLDADQLARVRRLYAPDFALCDHVRAAGGGLTDLFGTSLSKLGA